MRNLKLQSLKQFKHAFLEVPVSKYMLLFGTQVWTFLQEGKYVNNIGRQTGQWHVNDNKADR